jgi:hypothetical protein
VQILAEIGAAFVALYLLIRESFGPKSPDAHSIRGIANVALQKIH